MNKRDIAISVVLSLLLVYLFTLVGRRVSQHEPSDKHPSVYVEHGWECLDDSGTWLPENCGDSAASRLNLDASLHPHKFGANYTRSIFTASSSTYTPQPGVSQVIVCGYGGGGGGAGGGTASAGNSTTGGGGGGGTIAACWPADVTPGTGVTVTIGAAGTGGTAEAAGGVGGDSTFGSILTFSGGSGGGQGTHGAVALVGGTAGSFIKSGSSNVACVSSGLITATNSIDLNIGPCGGRGGSSVINNATTNPGIAGDQSFLTIGSGNAPGGTGGTAGGAGSVADVPGAGGGGGGAGPSGAGGNGGNGGNGNTGGAGQAGAPGQSPAANLGSGGGAGGGGGIGTTTSGTGGTGGNGSTGKSWVISWE